jgi:predicted nucleic acid-binding protein
MTLADTDVLIDFLAGREPAAERLARELESGNLWTTVITRFEMLSGARGVREMKIIGELLNSMRIVPLDISAADRAAGIRRLSERASGLEWRIA